MSRTTMIAVVAAVAWAPAARANGGGAKRVLLYDVQAANLARSGRLHVAIEKACRRRR